MPPQQGFFRRISNWLTVLSHWIWILTGLTTVAGFIVACGGVYIEAKNNDYQGLYTIILAPLFFVLSGIGATVAAKFESEEQSKSKTKSKKR